MTKPKESHRDWFATGLAAVSILLSVIALWYSTLSPGDVESSVSAPMFLWQPAEVSLSASGQSKPKLMIAATCSFSNNGARFGEVNYFVLRFESEDGTKWIFAPYWVIDDAKLMTDGFAGRTWLKEPVHPIVVPGKQTEIYSYMFVAESGLSSFTDANLTPHKFRVTLLTWPAGDTLPREQQTSVLDLDQDAVNNLARGVMFGMPFAEQQSSVQMLK